MIFTIIIYSCDHGYYSYVEFQLGLQNSINIIIFDRVTFTYCIVRTFYLRELRSKKYIVDRVTPTIVPYNISPA